MKHNPGIFIKIRMIVTLIYMLLLLPVLCAITIVVSILTLGRLSTFLTHWIGYIMGASSLAVAGVRFKKVYHGEKPKDPAIFLINHSSTLDLFIIVSLFLPGIRYIAKRELLYNPFFWVLTRFSGQIMIDRKDSRKSVAQLREAARYVKKNGNSLFFAPEGTRSETGEIAPFKSGAFHMAMDLGYPIIPIYIEGAYELCPGKSLVTLPGTVTVHFHPPIDSSHWEKGNIRKHIEEVRNRYLEWSEVYR
ncbi:lysophospholipid acyltransferase family protein [Balneolales bacterium ANBcel1]|nr:lysophospholipid acyltransferase family protein [Balneolales bacterium ANBcel1]